MNWSNVTKDLALLTFDREAIYNDAEPDRAEVDAVVKGLLQRDPEAMAQLYDQYGRQTYSLILRIVCDTGIAEDLVQESFLCVWNRIYQFDSEKGTISSWLLTIARNRALDYLRSTNRRRSSTLNNAHKIEDPNSLTDLESKALSGHTLNPVANALKTLSAKQRTVIDMAYFGGYSQSEIAVQLGEPLGTVKSCVRSALRAMRSALGPQCEEGAFR